MEIETIGYDLARRGNWTESCICICMLHGDIVHAACVGVLSPHGLIAPLSLFARLFWTICRFVFIGIS